jgi:predicted nucleic acid-binding Zn ribbon protein
VVEPYTGVCSGERRAVNRDRERRRGVQALFLLLAILAGAVVPIQFAVKSELREAVGGT